MFLHEILHDSQTKRVDVFPIRAKSHFGLSKSYRIFPCWYPIKLLKFRLIHIALRNVCFYRVDSHVVRPTGFILRWTHFFLLSPYKKFQLSPNINRKFFFSNIVIGVLFWRKLSLFLKQYALVVQLFLLIHLFKKTYQWGQNCLKDGLTLKNKYFKR